MTETNGISKHEDAVSVSHLGKRKRALSPENDISKGSILQPALQDVLQLLRNHDPTHSLLKYPLPASTSDIPDPKRARLVKSESVSDTIEDRILTGTYDSLHALQDDIKTAHDAILTDATASTQAEPTGADVRGQLSKILDVLERYRPEPFSGAKTNGEVFAKADSAEKRAKQFLSLRSNVTGAPKQLFSGLQVQQRSRNVKSDTLLGDQPSRLPNGFELGDFSALGGEEEDLKKQEKRTFEKVFTTLRRLKPLDLPHPAKDVVRGNILDFIPNSSRAQNLPQNKHDYKFAKLATSSWLSYRHSQQDRRKAQQSSSGTDFKAALAANNVRQGKEMSEDELFGSVYSSFAPSSDNAYSLISDEDLSRQWWKQHGEHKLTRLFRSTDQEVSLQDGEAQGSDEFADLVATFEPEEAEEGAKPSSAGNEVDALLEEVSEMIDTLGSYQRNRSLDIIAAGKVQKPEKPEFDMFELLRNQLIILIASLPPFAIAKLDGDQLEKLNISTRLVVEAPEYPGNGQPDDYLLRRQKMAQQSTQAASRPTATPQPVRPSYSSVQANTTSYNSQLRNYTASVPATAAYGMRTPQNYHTPSGPRPTHAQTPAFQASTTTTTTTHSYSANRPTIQQFQRPPTQNSRSSYGSSNNTPLQPSTQQPQSQSQTPGTFRPTQPGYQQRAQDNAAAIARSASPQKPTGLVNGAGTQQPYTPRTYQPPQQEGQTQTPMTAQQYALPRQGSGTPSTPIAPTMAARYDGAADRPASAQSAGSALPKAAAPAPASTSQTVEVSQ